MDNMDPVYFILMGNTKQIDNKYIKKMYDLKGSMVKRIVKGNESDFKNTACLKDQNIMKFQKDEIFLKFSSHDREEIIHQMAFDASLLSLFNLMDYSLLFVVAYNPRFVERNGDLFEKDNNGAFRLIKPERTAGNSKSFYKTNQRKVVEEFFQKMSGLGKRDFDDIVN